MNEPKHTLAIYHSANHIFNHWAFVATSSLLFRCFDHLLCCCWLHYDLLSLVQCCQL